MPDISGRCLCGSVSYSCSSTPLKTTVCHCSSCQLQTGTAFSTIVIVRRDDFVLNGEDALGEYTGEGSSGKPVRRKFCKNCGSPVISIVEAFPKCVMIKAGTLDDKSWLEPSTHIWCDDAQPWVTIDDSLEQYAESPPMK